MAQQPAAATIAGRPQPQTTNQVGTGPFVQLAKQAQRFGYDHSGLAFSGSVTDPFPQVAGFARRIDMRIKATGGAASGTNAVASTDMTLTNTTVVNYINLKDPMGTSIISGSGFDILYLLPLFGGQYGLLKSSDITTFPSYSAPDTGGNFTVDCSIPLEGSLAYGMLAMGNASALPTMQVTLNPAATTVYSTSPGTLPTGIQIACDIPFYAVDDPTIEPEGLGTTFQWVTMPSPQLITASSGGRVQLGRMAGYVHTLVLYLRDSSANPARVDAFGTRVKLWIDGVQLYDETFDQIRNRIWRESGGLITRPTGVIAYSWRESISQLNLGLADSNLRLLPITPGSMVEIECTPWGSGGTSPYTLSALVGAVIPRGPLATGLGQQGG